MARPVEVLVSTDSLFNMFPTPVDEEFGESDRGDVLDGNGNVISTGDGNMMSTSDGAYVGHVLNGDAGGNRGKSKKRVSRPGKPKQNNYRGVYRIKKGTRYKAQIQSNGEQNYLGIFDSEIDAARCYDFHALQLLGDKAKPNFQYTEEQLVLLKKEFAHVTHGKNKKRGRLGGEGSTGNTPKAKNNNSDRKKNIQQGSNEVKKGLGLGLHPKNVTDGFYNNIIRPKTQDPDFDKDYDSIDMNMSTADYEMYKKKVTTLRAIKPDLLVTFPLQAELINEQQQLYDDQLERLIKHRSIQGIS
jgi:hypothetical protein